MTSVLLWLPALPPVSVSMGINVTSSGIAAMAASYRPRIPPVIMPEIISTSSHTMRCLARENTPVFRYGLSDGAMAAIFSKSSVASCSITSTASSTVTMPTKRPSASTTGNDRKPYRCSSRTASSWSVPVATEMTPSSITSLTSWLSRASSRLRTVTTPSSLRRGPTT